MDLLPTEEQRLLKESVDRFIDADYTFDKRRQWAAGDGGFSPDNWATFADLGWLALSIPEDHGGLGGSLSDTVVLCRAFGRGLVVEPYLSTVIVGAGLVTVAGSEAQRNDILPKVAEGHMKLAFAHSERQSRYDLFDVATEARADGDGFVLTGHKAVVFNADTADRLIVGARVSGDRRDRIGIGLFLVDPKADGVRLRAYQTQDGGRAAEVALDGVTVGADAVLGSAENGLAAIELVVDYAMIALAAEAAGAMETLNSQTSEFLGTREQFGVAIGTFQILQHTAVDMFMEQELAMSLMERAAASVSGEPAVRAKAAAAAKIRAGRAGKIVGQSAVHLHGGMGMTDELPVGHYFKRLAMIDVTYGTADHHLKRLAMMD
ncbi:MAG: pimeloyl-CoA dehydrogenase small subunit [Alphaproteobacteria bacterium]|nr:MAG: pimeloyl-CoA dehydrogenase small subunit [Alphaproteobacteria bacterium]